MIIGARVKFLGEHLGTVEGQHPLGIGWLVRLDGAQGQGLMAEKDLTVLSEPRSFQSTGAAYDACQCDDTIKNGDVLHCEREGVVGLAWTWPVAVTVEYGALHTPAYVAKPQTWNLPGDAGWTLEHIRAAVALCTARGYAVNPVFLEALQ